MRQAETLVKRLLARRCRQALRQHAIVANEGNPAAVHDLRVATRRLQEILDFLEPVLPVRPRRRLSRRARRIRRDLGQIRNIDVMRDLVKSLASRCTPTQERCLNPLKEALAVQARALRDSGKGRRGVKLPDLGERVGRLRGHPRPADGFSILKRAREILLARAAKLEVAIQPARTGKTAALHALRIVIKRHRYALEILEESGVRRARPAISAARALQTRLGRIHDIDLLAALVRERVGRTAARSLLARLAVERRERLIDTLKAIDRFDPTLPIAIVDAAVARVEAA